MALRVEDNKCIGCEVCVHACPYQAIEMVDERATLNEACILCGACAYACPTGAIVLDRGDSDVDITQYEGIWVVGEVTSEGTMAMVTAELIGEGGRLAAEIDTDLSVVLMGDDIRHTAEQAAGYGADRVFVVDHPALARYRTEPFTRVMADLIEEHKPEIVLAGATSMGRDLAARLAARLKVGMTADCIELRIDPETRMLEQTRPAFGGNLLATILCEQTRPQMASVRPNTMGLPSFDESREAEVIEVPVEIEEGSITTKILEVVRDESRSARKLVEADIIVGGGRGFADKQQLSLLDELAEQLGAAVGFSRALVDQGWVSSTQQIGQSGKIVHPKLYIACGISGAIQHVAGITGSDCIVAINKDPDAPIFEVAHYGVVGDVAQVLPAMTEAIKARRGE